MSVQLGTCSRYKKDQLKLIVSHFPPTSKFCTCLVIHCWCQPHILYVISPVLHSSARLALKDNLARFSLVKLLVLVHISTTLPAYMNF